MVQIKKHKYETTPWKDQDPTHKNSQHFLSHSELMANITL